MTVAEHLAPYERAYWEELLATGKPMAEIGRIAGVHRDTVYVRMKALGIKPQRFPKPENRGNAEWQALENKRGNH